jgi:hypothetical protein
MIINSQLFHLKKSDFKHLNKTITLKSIKSEVDRIAKLISASDNYLPTYGYSRDLGYSHVEVDKKGLLHYVIVDERGQERERKTTGNLTDLLFWIFDGITFSMASDYEITNRKETQDCRRLLFVKQEELLGIIDKGWKEVKQKEHGEILKRNPFDDLASLRADFFRELRGKGYSQSEVDQLAYEKYPKSEKNSN